MLDELLNGAHAQRHHVRVGRARRVQPLLRALRVHGVPASQVLTKACWADGKSGFD